MVDSAMCTLLDPLTRITLFLRTCSLLLGARSAPRESASQTSSGLSLSGASAAPPSAPPPVTRTPLRT
eukprot:4703607-Pleurochrysis_carterae.AAC.1